MFKSYQTQKVIRESINHTPALIKVVSQGGGPIVVAQALILLSLALYYIVTDGTRLSIKERVRQILDYIMKTECSASQPPKIEEKRVAPVVTFAEILRQAVPPIKVNMVTITRMTHHFFWMNRVNSDVSKARPMSWLLNGPLTVSFKEISMKSNLPLNEPSDPPSRIETEEHSCSPIENKSNSLPVTTQVYSPTTIESPVEDGPKEEADIDIFITGTRVPCPAPRLNKIKWLKKVYLPSKPIKNFTVA